MADEMSPELAEWLRVFVARASGEEMVERFVDQVDGEIMRQIPAIAEDPLLAEDLHRSTQAQWRSFVVTLPQEHRLVLPEQAADLARSLARRDLDLGVLLKIYRAAAQSVFAFFTEDTKTITQDGPARDEVLVHIWQRADRWIDESVEALMTTFYDERQRQLEGTLQRRAEMVTSLLDDPTTSPDEASTVLGHPVQHWQTALVLWSTGSPDGVEHMLGLARRAASALAAPTPLTRVAGSRELWCWIATATRPDLSALDDLAATLEEHDLRAAVGVPAPGVDGFRSAHREARAAERLVATAPSGPWLVHYPQVELLCLTAGNETLVRRMVEREVAPLCGADKNLALVRLTALTYLRHRMSVEATAEELFVHKNTVRYRISRAEELLGRPLSDRASLTELALRHVALFGPPG